MKSFRILIMITAVWALWQRCEGFLTEYPAVLALATDFIMSVASAKTPKRLEQRIALLKTLHSVGSLGF